MLEDTSWYKAKQLAEKIPDPLFRNDVLKSIESSDQLVRQVTVFHKVYGLPIIRPDQACIDFSHITKHRLAMRFGLIVEEFMELCEEMDIRADINFYYLGEEGQWIKARSVSELQASEDTDGQSPYFSFDKETNTYIPDHEAIDDKAMHEIARERLLEAVLETDERDIVGVADACGDLKYVIQGFELEVGIPSAPVLAEIQCSNLSKLGEDGRPIYREDGKVLKGPNYFKADIRSALTSYGLRLSSASTRI